MRRIGFWRPIARRVIADVLAELPADAKPAAIEKALRLAYPFGARANWPYTVWLDEQRATLESLGIRAPKPAAPTPPRPVPEGQQEMRLFDAHP